MQELSLNVLDIAQNSIKAKATLVEISVICNSNEKTMLIKVDDNGCGMSSEQVSRVIDPFFTTRTTRKVGLGVPFFKMSAELTGGTFSIKSEPSKGTWIESFYHTDHLDMMPLGDMAATMVSLISVNQTVDFTYTYAVDGQSFTMDTKEVKAILEGMPVDAPEVLAFIKDFILENENEINSNINKVVQDL